VDCREVRRVLDAFVDNELGPAEAAAVREHLDGCAACRHRLASLESLGRLVRGIPYYAAPEALRVRIATTRGHAYRARSVLAWVATLAIVASLAGGSLLIRSLRSGRSAEAARAVAGALVDNHVRALMGEHLLDVASSDQHTVKPWFQGKLDFSPPVEDLASAGFPLVGGRIEYVGGKQAAALIYRRRQHTINLFVWPVSDQAASGDVQSMRGFQVRHWTRGGMAFWAVSDLNDGELATFAQALQH
jgi:anti-sigma factor RsiW